MMSLTLILAVLCFGAVIVLGAIVIALLLQNWQASRDERQEMPEPDHRPLPASQTTGEIDERSLAQIAALLKAGNKIGAIKVYRQVTGMGLKEAKDAVEALEQDAEIVLLSKASDIQAGSQPGRDWKAEMQILIAENQKLEAIKVVRDATGMGLREAKDFVEAAERGEPVFAGQVADPVAFPANSEEDWQEQVHQLLRLGKKIEAIKIYRDMTGLGLKEAKDAVEAIERTL
jgi:ribosomal protein L7/L12